jgi:hypothetical protein
MSRTAQKMTRPTIPQLLRVFVAVVTFLTGPIPIKDMGIQTHRLRRGIYEVRR